MSLLKRGWQSVAALALIAVAASPAPPVEATQPPLVKAVMVKPPSATPPAYTVKRALTIDEPIVHGYWTWDERGAPATGRIVITVDTKAQTMSVLRDGYEIGMAVVLYGADWKPTPTGVYPITQKKRHHVSTLYDAPMPYMQRLTGDGVAIHASDVREGYATHGCIGVPAPFAKKLFEATTLGDMVIITHGEMLKVGDTIDAAT